MTEQTIRVLICDDQDVVRKGIHIILTHSEGLEVIATAENGEQAAELAAQHQPDVILMDLKMPVLNGIHATRRITAAHPHIKVVVLTTYDADDWVFDAIRAGASGYLLKDTDGEVIAQAVRDAYEGKVHLDPQIAGKVLSEFNRLHQKPLPKLPADAPELEELTEREMSILELMAQGLSNNDIAESLFLATGTVKNNVSNIMGKLHANDRTQAVITAFKRGLVDL